VFGKRKHKLNKILEDLVGSSIHLSYVSTAGEGEDVYGTLEQVDADIIQVKDILGATVWINRRASILTNVKLLKKRRKKPSRENSYNFRCP